MESEFFFQTAADDVLAMLQASAPTNPFSTAAYVAARKSLGYDAGVVGIRKADGTLSASASYFTTGTLRRLLEVTSLSPVAESGGFWEGLYGLCRKKRITDLQIDTFGSPSMQIPSLQGEVYRKPRREYVLPLQEVELERVLSSNHKRNIKKARAAELTMRRTRGSESCRDHVRLMQHSIDRRIGRGENAVINDDIAEYTAYLESGAGELFQAVRNDVTLSSVLVLRSESGAYYQSAGTTPEGFEVGASHFLIHSISTVLKQDKFTVFNLGGADIDSSLARFKSGFGTTVIPLEAVSCYLGSVWLKRVTTFAGFARRYLKATPSGEGKPALSAKQSTPAATSVSRESGLE
jgi:hypothetical protein